MKTNLFVATQASALIPRGVADYFWEEALQRRRLEGALLETFRRWGYEDVIPPMFEYTNTFNRHASHELQAEMVRFQDRDGSTLALRADMTIAVARLVGTRLHDWPMPQRFCYTGSVFRDTALQAGRQREFLQAGIELLGAPGPAADAEILALTAKALPIAGVTNFRLVLGHIGYFYGLLQDLQLAPAQQLWLQQAIDRNSEPEVADFLRTVTLQTQQRRTLEELSSLSGPNAVAIIAQAETFCLNPMMRDAVENLRAICVALDSYGLLPSVYLDLTEIHNLGYYTGLTFEALAPGLGFPVATGGRYDHMIGAFGKPEAAVGAAFSLDRILLAQRDSVGQTKQPRPVAPDLLVAAKANHQCLGLVEQWRAQGLRVAVDVSGHTASELWQIAQKIGCKRVLDWTGAGFDVYENAAQPLQPTRHVAVDNLEQLMNLGS